jgi:hypothetical protein
MLPIQIELPGAFRGPRGMHAMLEFTAHHGPGGSGAKDGELFRLRFVVNSHLECSPRGPEGLRKIHVHRMHDGATSYTRTAAVFARSGKVAHDIGTS